MSIHKLTAPPARILLAAVACLIALLMLPGRTLAADLVAGKRHYTAYCAGCHGVDGMSLRPQAPKLALGERMAQPDFMLVSTLKSGFGTHPSFLGILNDRELLDVVSYVRTLR
jgi:cytochrome c6